MQLPYFTIGHSNRSIEDFIGLLKHAGVQRVVDVRKIPASRANPQFNADALRGALAPFQISYSRIPALGGLRGKGDAEPVEINAFWTNQSFHNYADYALSAEFHTGLDQLLRDGEQQVCATMCAEAVWWRCHRRIITDYLIASGRQVFNIVGQGRLEPAQISQGAVIQPDGTIHYPAQTGNDTTN